MSGLKARIIRLERYLPTDIKAQLRVLSDEELEGRIGELLGATAEEVHAWTPEARRRLKDEIRASLAEAEAAP